MKLFSVENLPEQTNRSRPVPRVVIVRVGVNLQIPPHELTEQFGPILHVIRSIHEGLIPRHGLLFNLFPVPEPANVSKIRRDHIELRFHFPRSR
jgi:hypothetical protein